MSYEEEMAGALESFTVEARELLTDMEDGLLGLETATDPTESVGAIFRAAHTIKGSSGLFGLNHIVAFTHHVETVLDLLRDGQIPVSSELVGVLLPCRDHIASLVEGVARGVLEENKKQQQTGTRLLAKLKPFLDASAAGDAAEAPAAAAAGTQAPAGEAAAAPVEGERDLHLSLRFGADCLRNGMDPLAFIRYLSTLGEVVGLSAVDGALPEAGQMDAETCYLSFELTLRTSAEVASVEGVFDFVREDGDIRVLTPGVPGPFVELVESYGELGPAVAGYLVHSGAVRAEDLEDAAPAGSAGSAAAEPDAPAATGTAAAIAAIPAQSRGAEAPVRAENPAAEAKRSEARSIRVDAPRLDRLIDVVGELVIAGAAAGLRASQAGNDQLNEAMSDVMRLVEEVRDSALQLRMVPIGTTFSRFQRVVRDVSAELGKDIQLVISGGDTEVDKALVERIGDPLMHLVRNSMDHGIESAEVRAQRGKPARGTLRLNAFHDSGSIVIEVQDDGGGLDRDKILAKAVDRGLIEPGAVLSDSEAYALIFEAGFSTADAVSNLSGRGVGMDVVKRNVTALRGTIDVESRPGEGSTMRIRLPLTLAIIDGFLVGVGSSSFVIPLDRVVECVELPPVQAGRDCMDLRGEVLPFIRLRSLFSIGGERARRENVVVVDYAGVKTGLVVDALLGEFQTVIKPLGQLFEHVQGIGGSTILGNGEVALIIDVPMLVRHYGARVAEQAGSGPAAAGAA